MSHRQSNGAYAARLIAAFILSVLLAYTLASVSQSLFVLASLNNMGVHIEWSTGLQTIARDFIGLTFKGNISLGSLLTLGFIVAMPAAALTERLLPLPHWLIYPVAGAVAFALILHIVKNQFFQLTFFAGTRGTYGYCAQLLAGALGGGVFGICMAKIRSTV